MISGICSQNLTQKLYYMNNSKCKTPKEQEFRGLLDTELGAPKEDVPQCVRKYNKIVLFQNAIIIALAVALMIAGKGNVRGGKSEQVFRSLSDDSNIPTLENCKSLNKNLRKILEHRVNLNKASDDILSEVGEDIKNANHFLLYGPSAVGKSLFAKIYAKTLGCDYMEILFSDANSQWVGKGIEKLESRLKYVLKTSKKNPNKNYVLVMNEMDSFIVPPENLSQSAGTHWVSILRERSVLLNYLERIQEEAPNVTLIGTTNILPKNNDRAAISRLIPVKVDLPEEDCLYEAMVAKLLKFEDGEKIVKESEKQLREIAKTMKERKFSFRDLNKVFIEAKQIYVGARINGAKKGFNVDYLTDGINAIEHSDGELALYV